MKSFHHKLKTLFGGNNPNHHSTQYSQLSYSQEGEDRVLQRYFFDKKAGFYVDIGACHPKKYSNSYLFYQQGWTGINIDPTPGFKKIFDTIRPKDLNLELALSDCEKEITLYVFNQSELNTFSQKLATQRLKTFPELQLQKKIAIKPKTCKQMFDQHLPPQQDIDFLSIDVESWETKIIESNDWQKYRPKLILVEIMQVDLEDIKSTKIYKILHQKNYRLFAKTFYTFFFKKND